MDPEIIAAVRKSLAAAPQSISLRTHLAELLVRNGEAFDALTELERVLAREPANLQALSLAALAARTINDDARATGYERLLQALAAIEDAPSDAGTGLITGQANTERVPLKDEPFEEGDIDAFLAEVLGETAPQVKLDDVGGLDQVKHRLRTTFLNPMQNPELRKAYGQQLRGGLLLYGPPGCGKTFIARAIAGELGASFFAVGLSDIMDMWLGSSEQKLHEVFELARRNTPCVLFFDEVDALGFKRSALSQSGARNVVVQLLTELDSVSNDNEGVFVLGATNQPWDVDPALRRPGRFDRTLLVLPPDQAAREAILTHHLAGRPIGKLDVAGFAARTEGMSGADLRLLCDAAGEVAMEEAFSTGSVVPINTQHMAKALQGVSPSVGPWFTSANNFAMFANQNGEYDELLTYIKKHKLGFGSR